MEQSLRPAKVADRAGYKITFTVQAVFLMAYCLGLYNSLIVLLLPSFLWAVHAVLFITVGITLALRGAFLAGYRCKDETSEGVRRAMSDWIDQYTEKVNADPTYWAPFKHALK